MTKIYKGVRHHDYATLTAKDTVSVFVCDSEFEEVLQSLTPYFAKKRAYDNTLDWGEAHKGFACTNLSASILADFLDLKNNPEFSTIPVELIMAFRDGVIRKLDWNEWTLDEDTILDFIENFEIEKQDALERDAETSDFYHEAEEPDAFSEDFIGIRLFESPEITDYVK